MKRKKERERKKYTASKKEPALLLHNLMTLQERKKERRYFDIWAASWQNQQNGMCAQRRLISAWTSAQSDQSFRCLHEEILGPNLHIERTSKTLIRLGGCAKIILLVLSWGGSYTLDVHLLSNKNARVEKKKCRCVDIFCEISPKYLNVINFAAPITFRL